MTSTMAARTTSTVASAALREGQGSLGKLLYTDELYDDLRRALEQSEFSIAFQPILDLRGNRVAGIEALLLARAVWGFGAAAPGGLRYAIARDLYAGDRMARVVTIDLALAHHHVNESSRILGKSPVGFIGASRSIVAIARSNSRA